jgi:hypothetical protein
MKLPTSTKPTSGFHICDILELNKDKQKKQEAESIRDDDEKSKTDENCDEDEAELKRENFSAESDENILNNENSIKRSTVRRQLVSSKIHQSKR